MKRSFLWLVIPTMSIIFTSCTDIKKDNTDNIVIENDEMKLTISPDGITRSLIHKPSNTECLMKDARTPAFSMWIEISQTPFNEFFKSNMILMGEHEFMVDSVYMHEGKVIAHFDIINIDAVIDVDIQQDYMEFKLEDLLYSENSSYGRDYIPEKYKFWLLRLPVRNRTHFGNWLNVIWDEKVAVNLLGTSYKTRIDSEKEEGYHILKAGCFSEVAKKGLSACLIATSTDKLLDKIATVEEDFGLPNGVKSRRGEQLPLSSYWTTGITPDNVDRHIKYALQGGFSQFYINYAAFSPIPGHYVWDKDYPNGINDLKAVVDKIEKAGLIPGVHIHFNKAGIEDKYVTPVPDHRLHHYRYYTLAAPLGSSDTTIYIEENPHLATMADDRRILRLGKELISYSGYTVTKPYKFTGCSRGALDSKPGSYPAGFILGLLNVDGWPEFIRYDQNTDIQEEVAERFAEIYNQAGFKFVYLDGAEDVHHPYWLTTPKAQWELYKRFEPEPLFAGASAMSHFSWHMLSRGNHYDSHKWFPGKMKSEIQKYLGCEAPLMAKNFTRTSFGRYRLFAPDENSIGVQPDMLEYLTSRAAGWDSPWVIKVHLNDIDKHPRTSDNLEVVRRWENAKKQGWLKEEQKEMLRDWKQEHILLVNEEQEFELVPYEQVKDIAGGSEEIRAFIFEREDGLYAAYWHISGDKQLELPVSIEDITLLEELGQELQISEANEAGTLLPVGKRRYVKTGALSEEEFISAFRNAKIID